MRYRDRRITSVASFLDELKRRKGLRQPTWYRGQQHAEWTLVPSITRITGGITAESSLITRFKQNALALLEARPGSEWEWLFVMRHYGVPTRLMDWTESPLVGLYFAAVNEPEADGAVWCLLPVDLNKAAGIRPQHPTEIPGFGDDPVLDNYLPSSLAKEQSSRLSPAAAIAPRNTRRMQAQHGVFTITHRDQMQIEQVGNHRHVWRLIVSARAKRTILQELAMLNIDQLSLFPELEHVATHARESLG